MKDKIMVGLTMGLWLGVLVFAPFLTGCEKTTGIPVTESKRDINPIPKVTIVDGDNYTILNAYDLGGATCVTVRSAGNGPHGISCVVTK